MSWKILKLDNVELHVCLPRDGGRANIISADENEL